MSNIMRRFQCVECGGSVVVTRRQEDQPTIMYSPAETGGCHCGCMAERVIPKNEAVKP